MDGRKIPSELENPLDDVLIGTCEQLNPMWYRIGLTPNILTTISLTIGVCSIICFFYKLYVISALLYILSYLFDCCDGNFARKYGMVTMFGDMYDHFNDVFRFIVVTILLLQRTESVYVFLVLFLLSFGAFYHMQCQEVHYDKPHESPFLNSLGICQNKDHIIWTRFLGCGTFVAVTAFLMSLTPYIQKKE